MIYLDYSANTPAGPRVVEAFPRASLDYPGNPNSRYSVGQTVVKTLVDVWAHIAALSRILPGELIFTSSATEANNLALLGSTATRRHVGRHIISTTLEHPSVSATLSYLQKVGYEIDLLPILSGGCTDLNAFSFLLRKDTCLVSLSAVDSELGTLQSFAEAVVLIRYFPDCHLHVDATQTMGKVPVDFSVADSVSSTPYRLYGLVGSGVLYRKKGIPPYFQLHGGESDLPRRSGIPALIEIRALETALELTLAEEAARYDLVAAHNVYLRAVPKGKTKVTVNSPTTAVPHILNLNTAGLRGVAVQAALVLPDICISVKSARSTDALSSRAAFAMSRSRKNALAPLRLSLSHLTTREELGALLGALVPLLY